MGNTSDKKTTKEIVLFLNKNIKYDIDAVTDEIEKRYPTLGKANIISYTNASGVPLFYFSEDKDMVISADNVSLSIVVHDVYFDELTTIVFDIVDIFEENNAKFVRIGYVTNIFLEAKYVDKIKSRFLNNRELDDISDYNIGWYRKLRLKHGSINCWEKFITESINTDDLLCLYDCNTPIDEVFTFEMKSIKEFFKVCNKFIESRVNDL